MMRTKCFAIPVLMALLSQEAGADRPLALHIEAQPMAEALAVLAAQTGVQMVFSSGEVAKDLRAHAVIGSYTTREALDKLLAGTGLGYEFVNDRTVAIYSGKKDAAAGAKSGTSATYGDRIRMAQARPGTEEVAQGARIEEVIVTAQKRMERLQDVPVPVTAVSAESLVSSNQLQLKDYYTRIPGLNMRMVGNASGQVLSIRGISTGSGNPTVGLMVDEVPYGGTTLNGGGLAVPDFDPGDLERIEVLRGPQGTLYGASSMGGLVQFVTTNPSTEAASGRIQTGVSSVQNGDEAGYNVRGSVNVPLGDSFAVRGSAFTRRDPGYIDNIQTGERAVNSVDAYGGRWSALWKPSGDLSLKLSALYQRLEGDGLPYAGINLGDLQQSFIPGVGLYDREAQAYSATLSMKLGTVDLTALSGYSVNRYFNSYDYTPFLGASASSVYGVNGAQFFQNNDTRKFTQEIRLSAQFNDRINWLLGAFYTDEKNSLVSDIFAANPASGAIVGPLQRISVNPVTYEEYAAFANLTFLLTDRFDIQVGGRHSWNDQSVEQVTSVVTAGPSGPVPAAPSIVPETLSKADAFTYLVTPRFKLTPNVMAYARLASGYRPGGPNSFIGGAIPGGTVPTQYEPDKTRNYEIGVKGNVMDEAFSFDVSLYHIDWTDLQVLVFLSQQNVSFTTNGGAAESKGVELSVAARPTSGLSITAWAVWNDAVVKENFPLAATVRGLQGDRLPFSSRFSGSLSVDQQFSIAASVVGLLGGSVSYVGDRIGVFQGPFMSAPGPSRPRQNYPSFTRIDLRAGVSYQDWTLDLFLNNASDERGAVSGGIGDAFATSLNYIQPRTVGLNLSKKF